MNRIFCIRHFRSFRGSIVRLLVAMKERSVRLLHLCLMLFLIVWRMSPLILVFRPFSGRDILGALMHLGIERSRMGDIAVCENQFYLFCHESMASLICSELTRIRHTSVRCITTDAADFVYTPKTKEMTGSVASIRLDALMAVAFQSSRSSLLSLISDGKVFVNGKLITTNAYAPKDGDLISARGEGKFRFVSSSGQTKKGRCLVKIEKYI